VECILKLPLLERGLAILGCARWGHIETLRLFLMRGKIGKSNAIVYSARLLGVLELFFDFTLPISADFKKYYTSIIIFAFVVCICIGHYKYIIVILCFNT